MEILELSDPRWEQMNGTYSGGEHVAAQVADLVSGRLSKESENHLWQELCHEYESTRAGYAAIPHLVRLSEKADGERALLLLGTAAFVLSCAQRRASHQIPELLRPSLDVASQRALKRIGLLLDGEVKPSPANTRTLAYTIASFMKNAQLFFDIEGLDCEVKCPKCDHEFMPARMPD